MNSPQKTNQLRAGDTLLQAGMNRSGVVSRGLSRTGYFLKRQLWIWPVIAVLILAVVGVLVRSSIEVTIKRNLASGLQTVLNLEVEMLRQWFLAQQRQAESVAGDGQIREAFDRLLSAAETGGSSTGERPGERLLRLLQQRAEAHDYVGFLAADRNGRILCSTHERLVGESGISEYDEFLPRVFAGESVVSVPFPSVAMMPSESGRLATGQPTMYVCVPVRNDTTDVIGALALQVRPDAEFTEILQFGRVGESGETYAFNRDGVLVSNSRFDEDLSLLGLIPDEEDARSILNVHVRDPGGNMIEGFRPTLHRADRPLTLMAADAVQGNSAVNVEGYRDYRGVPVVGAWTWLPDYQIGVTTEVDVAQAFGPVVILQRAFWILFALLTLSAAAIFVFTLIVARLQRDARKAAIQAQKLGQYTLEEQLGVGAMGVVYKGHHSMMRRATAIKLLNADKVNDLSIARFEREVQLTCRLNHPNTIAIYDYGRTPEGVFYYAMEYLDGIDLQDLVETSGPQPEARVIRILRQICGSLHEAHSLGLVHRDIKPANVVLCRRGGRPDVVKVLDFGLVRAVDQDKESAMTVAGALTGTPQYMSPEAIQSPAMVDGRSDLYAVGAVGYFLLTGHVLFAADSVVELCRMHVDVDPPSPSRRLGQPVSPELESLILACLQKSPADRPQSAQELIELLDECEDEDGWTYQAANEWWDLHSNRRPSQHDRRQPESAATQVQTVDGTSSESVEDTQSS